MFHDVILPLRGTAGHARWARKLRKRVPSFCVRELGHLTLGRCGARKMGWAKPSREESQVERASFPGRQSARDSTPSWTYIVAPDIHTSSRRKADLQVVESLETGDGEEAG
jgi:hypothetical protein